MRFSISCPRASGRSWSVMRALPPDGAVRAWTRAQGTAPRRDAVASSQRRHRCASRAAQAGGSSSTAAVPVDEGGGTLAGCDARGRRARGWRLAAGVLAAGGTGARDAAGRVTPAGRAATPAGRVIALRDLHALLAVRDDLGPLPEVEEETEDDPQPVPSLDAERRPDEHVHDRRVGQEDDAQQRQDEIAAPYARPAVAEDPGKDEEEAGGHRGPEREQTAQQDHRSLLLWQHGTPSDTPLQGIRRSGRTDILPER